MSCIWIIADFTIINMNYIQRVVKRQAYLSTESTLLMLM
jgi:hypothetical protein